MVETVRLSEESDPALFALAREHAWVSRRQAELLAGAE